MHQEYARYYTLSFLVKKSFIWGIHNNFRQIKWKIQKVSFVAVHTYLSNEEYIYLLSKYSTKTPSVSYLTSLVECMLRVGRINDANGTQVPLRFLLLQFDSVQKRGKGAASFWQVKVLLFLLGSVTKIHIATANPSSCQEELLNKKISSYWKYRLYIKSHYTSFYCQRSNKVSAKLINIFVLK